MANKVATRQQFLTQRKELDLSQIESGSNAVFQQFQKNIQTICPNWDSIQTVGLYFPIHGEVLTFSFFQFAQDFKKTTVFPKMGQNLQLDFRVVNALSELVAEPSFGVLEPSAQAAMVVPCPDLIFVPGVVFSQNGDRMGYGKGYYDRTVEAWHKLGKKPILVGLAYDFQVIPQFPKEVYSENHNQPLDFVVTESEIFSRE